MVDPITTSLLTAGAPSAAAATVTSTAGAVAAPTNAVVQAAATAKVGVWFELPFKGFHSLDNGRPAVPPEMQGAINSFGFPTALKRLHARVRELINKIPYENPDSMKTRDMFMTVLNEKDRADAELVAQVCERLGYDSALTDMMEQRISAMTPAEFIVDKELATPDQMTVERIRDQLLGEDRERFAQVKVAQGQQRTNEWAHLNDDGPKF